MTLPSKSIPTRRAFLGASTAAMFVPSVMTFAKDVKVDPNKKVRCGIIGIGSRGTGMLRTLLKHPAVEVNAVCDIKMDRTAKAQKMVKDAKGNTPDGYGKEGDYDYRNMLKRNDLDAMVIYTPIPWHAQMACDSMNAGLHVATEVPGACTIDECWDLVNAKEKNDRKYMLLENYTFTPARMAVWNMAKKGLFGDVYYGECSYIHDCSGLRFNDDGLTWRGELKRDHYGNQYPTHSLGPLSKWMNINHDDVFVTLNSVMSRPMALNAYAARRFGKDSPEAKIKFKAGDMCVTTIRSANGKLVTVYYDTDSPRPADIFYLIQGTEGVYDSRRGTHIVGNEKHSEWSNKGEYSKKYEHEMWKNLDENARKAGHGGGDYLVQGEFINAILEDREPLIDVYDSALWSCITPLSQQSIDQNGAPMAIPDFTRGKWKTRS